MNSKPAPAARPETIADREVPEATNTAFDFPTGCSSLSSLILAVAAVTIAGCGGGSSGDSNPVAIQAPINGSRSTNAPASQVDAVPATRSQREVDPYVQRSAGSTTPSVDVVLGPLKHEGESSAKELTTGISGAVLTGYSRPIAQTRTAAQVSALLEWRAIEAGGARAAIRMTSTQAKAIRVAIEAQSVPLGARFRFYAEGSDRAYEITQLALLGNVQRNQDSGATGDLSHLFWSPAMAGPMVTLEIEVADKADISRLKFSIPSLMHATVEPGVFSSAAPGKSSGACTLDVTCTEGLGNASRSDAMIEFVGADGNLYACSGTLLNDGTSSGTPYFLTANHCVSDQTSASSISVYWNYRSSSCNSGVVEPSFTRTEGGATLLYASAQTDTSLLRLDTSPPAGVVYAGFDARALSSGDSTYGVSHPSGGLQKYTRSVVAGFTSCKDNQCTWAQGSAGADDQNFYRVDMTEGAVQSGSSGSAIYKTVGGRDYLFGQLMATTGSCEKPGSAIYGRFDKPYATAMHRWLSPAAGSSPRIPVYRLYNNKTREHFYTADVSEREALSQPGAAFSYEGIAFHVGAAGEKTGPVYRFYNQSTGGHFYTANVDERAAINAGNPTYREDGIAWTASGTAQPGTVPMFRFYESRSNSHFYTASPMERDAVVASQGTYQYEGIAYYVWTTP